MLKQYSIRDMPVKFPKQVLYYVCSLEEVDESRLVWPHKRSFYSITWFIEGHGINVIDFTEYPILPNRIFLTSPEQVHNRTFHSDAKGYILMLDKALVTQLGINFTSPYIDMGNDNIPLLKLVIENIINKKKDSAIEIDLLYFYSLIIDQIDNKNAKSKETNILFREFKKLILSNNYKIESMNQYADTLHISVTSLNDICQIFTGISAKQFLLDVKITEAKRLLIYSQLNISNIAYKLGFEDASYFARIFKKKTISSPSAFLKKYRRQTQNLINKADLTTGKKNI